MTNSERLPEYQCVAFRVALQKARTIAYLEMSKDPVEMSIEDNAGGWLVASEKSVGEANCLECPAVALFNIYPLQVKTINGLSGKKLFNLINADTEINSRDLDQCNLNSELD